MKVTVNYLSLSTLFTIKLLLLSIMTVAKEFKISSPDSNIKAAISINKKIKYTIHFKNEKIIKNAEISLKTKGKGILGKKPQIENVSENQVNNTINKIIEGPDTVQNNYNELRIYFKNNYGIIFRAYDIGIAYRWFTEFNEKIVIKNEKAEFSFTDDFKGYIPYSESYCGDDIYNTTFESYYTETKVSGFSKNKLAIIPSLFISGKNTKILLAESDLRDYPGMFLSKKNKLKLKASFAPYPLKEKDSCDGKIIVSKKASCISKTEGERQFPWRIIALTSDEKDLPGNDLVYKLAHECKINNTSWIKPGKVAWDWWNDLNLHGVNFNSDVNTATYKYFIDFAAKNNIEYVNLDRGWSNLKNLFKINPEVDLQELINYADKKKVGVFLWCSTFALRNQMDTALKKFEEWGVSGLKIDYMNRNDQKMVNFYHEVAEKAAKHHLLVNFHGSYPPSGLRRKWPNVLTREGVKGLEQMKWVKHEKQPQYDVTVPFIRMFSGPMDYTPGAMTNAAKGNFASIYQRPMSQGTRCHQLAMYVTYDSPLQMLSDAPTEYEKEPEFLDFLANIPVTWNDKKVLEGKIGKFIVTAKRKNNTWYVGALTNWDEREIELETDFLDKGNYKVTIYKDGINAHDYGNDYKIVKDTINSGSTIHIKMAPGGGWLAKFTPDN